MDEKKNIYVSIVIPAYNEEDRIVRTLENTFAYLKEQPYVAEVLVVSDGSKDKTVEMVCSIMPPANVSVLALEYFPNRGKGYAVRYGMLKAEGEYVLFMDADYSVPIEFVEPALALLQNGADIAIASRRHPDSDVKNTQNFVRHMSSVLFNIAQAAYLGLHFKDTQCGFKMFKKVVAQDVVSQQKLNSVIFDPEILWIAQKKHCTIQEFPVTWVHDEDSRIQYDSLSKSLFIFQELFRIRSLHPDIR